jgi:hypothetical protein
MTVAFRGVAILRHVGRLAATPPPVMSQHVIFPRVVHVMIEPAGPPRTTHLNMMFGRWLNSRPAPRHLLTTYFSTFQRASASAAASCGRRSRAEAGTPLLESGHSVVRDDWPCHDSLFFWTTTSIFWTLRWLSGSSLIGRMSPHGRFVNPRQTFVRRGHGGNLPLPQALRTWFPDRCNVNRSGCLILCSHVDVQPCGAGGRLRRLGG